MLDFVAYFVLGTVLVTGCNCLGYGLVLLLEKVIETVANE